MFFNIYNCIVNRFHISFALSLSLSFSLSLVLCLFLLLIYCYAILTIVGYLAPNPFLKSIYQIYDLKTQFIFTPS